MGWEQVRARRLTRHGLVDGALGSATEAARALCGVHAQVMTAAEISVAIRLDGVRCADVRATLWDERTLVKTFGPRGTVHLLATEDLPLWCGALSAVPVPTPSSAVLSPAQTDLVVAAVRDALAEAPQPLTMDELSAEVVTRTGSWAADPVIPAFQGAWPRWRRAIQTSAHRGALVFGPPRGRVVTFISPQTWRADFTVADADQALRWLLHSYLRSYGPARPGDYARWLSTTPGWAAQQFDAAAAELAEIELAGERSWLSADDVASGTPHPELGGIRLLPYFDNYAVASHPRTLLFPGRAADRALRSGQAGVYPVLLRDGEVAGVWHRKSAGRRATVTVEPLGKLAAGERRALQSEVERLAYVTATPTVLVVGPVTVGPHA